MTMSNTLTLLDRTPDWIEALCREIDTLKFASAFDTFTPDAILAFGVKQITGAAAMQAFFVKSTHRSTSTTVSWRSGTAT
jgi:hypothetical protein